MRWNDGLRRRHDTLAAAFLPLLTILPLLLVPARAFAQTGCSVVNNVNTCTVPAGSDNYIVTYNGPVLISNSNALSANVIGTVAQAIEGQSFGSEGGTDSNGNGTLGTQAFAVTINNKGAIGINTLNHSLIASFTVRIIKIKRCGSGGFISN